MIPGIVASASPVTFVPPVSDALSDATVALLHFDGGNSDTVTVDERFSELGIAWTFSGSGTEIQTSQSVFGVSSLYIATGSARYVRSDTSRYFGFRQNDYTVEGRFRIDLINGGDGSGYYPFFDFREITNENKPVVYRSGADGSIRFFLNGSDRIVSAAGILSANTWYHIALSRKSGVTRLFLDGVQVGGNYADTNYYTGSARVCLGAFSDNVSSTTKFVGWIDEFRILNGIGLFDVNFTPAVAQYDPAALSWTPDEFLTSGNVGPGLTFYDDDWSLVRNIAGNDAPDNSALSVRARDSGKAYFEFVMVNDPSGWSGYAGMIDSSTVISSISPSESYLTGLQIAPNRDGLNQSRVLRAGAVTTPASGYATLSVVGFAVDFDAGEAFMRVNDDWFDASDGKSSVFNAAAPTFTFAPGTSYSLFAMSPFSQTDVMMNLGPGFARARPAGFEDAYW